MIIRPEGTRHPHTLVPLGGDNATTKITTAYENIVLALSDTGESIDIARGALEDMLAVELGISQKDTMQRHVALLVRLGYVKVAQRGGVSTGARYDLIGVRLREIRKARGIKADKPAKKGAKTRR